MSAEVRRPSLATEDRDLAGAFGRRLRAERQRVGLTQAALADGRYTKAYVSALEHGRAKPSMAALSFFARRLGVDPTRLLQHDDGRWSRLEADLRLASGDWAAAVDAYVQLLDDERRPVRRAELQRGLAEAYCRLDRPAEGLRAATEATEAFRAAGMTTDAARARYWVAAALYQQDNEAEARAVFRLLLDAVRSGLPVEPDFELRLLIALATVDARSGQPDRSLTYLTEARARLGELDDRRRATYLTSLAIGFRETGDNEAAIALANQGLGAFRALEADREMALLENELALAHLALGGLKRAREHTVRAESGLRKTGDERALAHVIETRAQIDLASGDPVTAVTTAAEAMTMADACGNHKAYLSAALTYARAQRSLGRPDDAIATLEAAGQRAHEQGRIAQRRELLTEWADLLAELGDTRRAYELAREALASPRT
jgi:tetratricopeptide (TPR) repeat protein